MPESRALSKFLAVLNSYIPLSARGRGNRWSDGVGLSPYRSIPAWAGEPPGWPGERPQAMVYPRVGGGTRYAVRRSSQAAGLSPRGRGNRPAPAVTPVIPRSIPAWAGEPYPRVGGGTLHHAGSGLAGTGLSPRGRGNHLKTTTIHINSRSIPAWAGEPCGSLPRPAPCAVYPRVGGGTYPLTVLPSKLAGLSPRGRGNHPVVLAGYRHLGSIPAWAGEPAVADVISSMSRVYPRVGGGTRQTPFLTV